MTTRELVTALVLGYPQPPEMLDPRFPAFLQCISGLLLTFLVTGASLIVGGAIGLILASCRRESVEGARARRFTSRLISYCAGALVEGVRSLPIAILVLLVFHLPYPLTGARIPDLLLAMAAFSLYAGVYLCEIIRSGLRSVHPEMAQSGRVLGLSPIQIFLRIELPLVCRTMTPDLINLMITLFKDSSALAIVAVSELTYIGRQTIMSEPGSYGLVMLLVLVMYWVPASFLSALALRAERGRAGGKHGRWLAVG